ncbi:uncharacterized protein A1O9_10325 [Exophiala aquamarina CBS 119918]|uniref:Increased recombination centers protein 6 n=1 Tax=Exophiala aquamarina CBS 119918 TaxID=1182545 RepID=A0A072PCS5_9EURO|nr:uncharacterized protein A1O9_10325 [Exophiala aquamarina CBS 119918]KEF53350.1 hypothetical protein A1O9_10325 [Exophiala aquamarina CBS 119918]
MTSDCTEFKPSSLRLLILAPPTDPTSKPPFPALLQVLGGSLPSEDVTSFAGYTSHPPLQLQTKYYQTSVSIWCDELPLSGPKPSHETLREISSGGPLEDNVTGAIVGDATLGDAPETGTDTSTLEEWKEQMLSLAAAEVRRVIGGLVVILPVSTTSSPGIPAHFTALIEAVHALREAIEDDSYGRDIASVLVLQGSSPPVKQDNLDALMEKLEEVCLSEKGILGWDFVAWDGQVVEDAGRNGKEERNEYGEQTGIKRVLEVIKGIDWSASPDIIGDEDDAGEIDLGSGDDDDATFPSTRSTNIRGSDRFSGLDRELQREMMELKFSMLSNDDNDDDDDDDDSNTRPPHPKTEPEDENFQVNQLPALMEQVVAIREAGSEMSPTERERFAKREIQRIMREMR